MARLGTKTLALVLVVCAFSAGCGGGEAAAPAERELVLGNIGWEENVAVSTLTKVVLEEELGYENVELRRGSAGALFRGVGGGELDAFQDVWTPRHEEELGEVADDVEQLNPWYRGTTKFSLAVPTYVKTEGGEDVRSMDQLDQVNARQVLGVEPGAAVVEGIPEEVIPAYGLDQRLVEGPKSRMLAEVERRYGAREPFVFVAWSPHWMNARYEFNYLEDPREAMGAQTDPSHISTIVNKELPAEHPGAYVFMKELVLTEPQVNEIEAMILNNGGDPVRGVNAWLRENENVVEPWVYAARQAQQRQG